MCTQNSVILSHSNLILPQKPNTQQLNHGFHRLQNMSLHNKDNPAVVIKPTESLSYNTEEILILDIMLGTFNFDPQVNIMNNN